MIHRCKKKQNNAQHNTQARGLVLPNFLFGGGGRMYFISIPTPLPHSKDLPFLLKTEVQIKVHLPLKNAIKYGSTH